MQTIATTLDGKSLGLVELARSADGRAMVDDQLVLAMRPLGSRVVLIVGSRQYCVALTDYSQVMGAAARITVDEADERPGGGS